ncbi:MAG: phenylacetate--CoA ligase family protein [Flavobacteriaceae bacterium]|nr:phenylacetate--CoA ligase family protein [Flavobacteriaceae bacterium]
MNIIDFSLKLNGFPIKEAQNKLCEIQNISEQHYETYITKAKKDIVSFHLKNNPFYKSICKKEFSTWNELPVLTKSDLQAPLKERISNGYALKDVYVNKTSGSTGNPFYFAKDKFSHALTWSIIQNRFNWHDLYGKKQARFYGIPSETIPRLKERTKDFLSNRYRFNVFDLSDASFEKWIQKFKYTKFVYLNGYTTVLVAFANYLNAKNIVLKDLCPSLKACVVTSEMCFEEDKTAMNTAFGIPVVNEYGASELDLIAFQNTKNQWIINTESLFIEIVDDNNTPLPFGALGRIIVTSLYNKAHPFIRYELGDLGILKKIDSKTIILEKLDGRREDIIHLPSGKTAPGLSFYYVTKSVMKDTGAVKEIKVIQTSLNTFEIHYASDSELSEKQMDDVKNALYEYLEPDLEVIFHKFDQLKRSKSGKLKQFTSLILQ